MSGVVVNANVTLDGVMQAPAGPDEDTRGGFVHGGWARPYFDQVMAEQAVAITTGVVIATYRPAEPKAGTTT